MLNAAEVKQFLEANFWAQLLTFVMLSAYAGWNIYRQRYEERQSQLSTLNLLRKPFFDKQFELVFETSQIVAALATLSDHELWKEKRLRFWQLYWGELAVVEDHRLELLMQDYGDLLTAIGDDFARRGDLKIPALDVARACRELLKDTWNLGLKPIGPDAQVPG